MEPRDFKFDFSLQILKGEQVFNAMLCTSPSHYTCLTLKSVSHIQEAQRQPQYLHIIIGSKTLMTFFVLIIVPYR